MKESSLLDLKGIFGIQCAKFYYKFKHGTLPSHLDFFVQNNQIHNHFTRNRENLHRFPTKRSRTNECIRHNIPTLINDLPKEPKAKIDTHSYLVLPTAINANYGVIIPRYVLYEIAMYVVVSDTKLIIYVNFYKYDLI